MTTDIAATLFQEFDEQAAVAKATRAGTARLFSDLLEACTKCVRGGGKILFFGNGGSAMQAQHFAAELVVRIAGNRASIPAIALSADAAILTAAANDFGFEQVFARQIEGLGRAGDMAFGLSTSGKSANVNHALRVAAARGLAVAGLSGRDGGEMASLVPGLLIVPSANTSRIQEMHLTLGHMLCAGLEQALGLA
jgi:D-sedoheptulose 7-phosphate isomerase